MTPEQKMQAVVEAAGECWHESLPGIKWRSCKHCNLWVSGLGSSDLLEDTANPSPTNLNELFRLSKKLGIWCRIYYRHISEDYEAMANESRYHYADTPSEALLNSLYQSVEAKT